MKGTGHTSAASPSTAVLEVVGHGVGHVYVSRRAAAVLAPEGAAIVPVVVRLVAAHRATKAARSEHAVGDAMVVIVSTPVALAIGVAGEDVAADA
jgi:hypothetical protein